ncbi:MAG: bile acid:sodium symporter [Pseudobdellovibrio sp.]|nr:bile acid:sodium symporter [Pseudobdellovibrio sp.]
MSFQFITTTALPIALIIIMFGLGLTLTTDDFRRVVKYPKPIGIGLFCQLIVLPLVAFGICRFFGLKPEFAIGLMVLAASPGGVTSNVFSHLSHGDVALNLTLTAINSAISAVLLPLLTALSIMAFAGQDQSIELQPKKIIEVFFIVIVPAALGMWVKKIKPLFAEKSDKPIRIFSMLVLVVIIIAAIVSEGRNILGYIPEVGLSVLLFNLISLLVGYFVPVIFGIDRKQAIAVSLEIGIHNGTLALFVAMTVLGGGMYAVPAALYSILMYITAGVLCWSVTRKPR